MPTHLVLMHLYETVLIFIFLETMHNCTYNSYTVFYHVANCILNSVCSSITIPSNTLINTQQYKGYHRE